MGRSRHRARCAANASAPERPALRVPGRIGRRNAVELERHLFRVADEGSHEELLHLCGTLTEAQAAGLYSDVEGGRTWLEGNMNWTRYNHAAPPGAFACKLRLTWLGTVMPPSSRHSGGVNVAMGDGSARTVGLGIDAAVWRKTGGRFVE